MQVQETHNAASGLAQLYGELRPDLLRFLSARLGNAAEAEEAIQDLWIRISKVSFGPVANGRAYLYRAAQNLALDRIRERRRRMQRDAQWSETQRAPLPGPEPADPRDDAESLLIAREEAATLASAIAALPEAAGRAFRMHKFDEMSHAQIAAALGISRSGVEKHIALAMAHLRRAMAN